MYDISFIEPSLLPRERLVSEGVDKLSHQELLSILLRTGNKKKSVYEIAQGLLSSVNSLKELSQLTLEELQEISGIGRVKAIELQAVIEFGRRIHKDELMSSEQIMSSQKLAHKIQQEIGHKKQEHLVALYLNTQNEIIHQQTIFIGTVHYALKHMATSIILAHNHPSGAVFPSKNDDEVTQRVLEACEVMGLTLLDHLIVSEENYYSYREETDYLV